MEGTFGTSGPRDPDCIHGRIRFSKALCDECSAEMWTKHFSLAGTYFFFYFFLGLPEFLGWNVVTTVDGRNPAPVDR